MEKKINPMEPTPDELAEFAKKLNADGEVTVEKKAGLGSGRYVRTLAGFDRQRRSFR